MDEHLVAHDTGRGGVGMSGTQDVEMTEAERAEVLDVEGEEVETHTTSLVVLDARTSALMKPVADEKSIVDAFHAYQELREALLEPSDFQEAERGKHFVKKSGWRKLAVAMGVSDKLIERTYDRDDKRRIERAEVTVRAIAPNGRFAEGIGICDSRERCCPRAFAESCSKGGKHRHCEPECTGFSHFSKPQHDIPSTAHTRAKNRALSDLFGFGEVSAEEITAGIGVEDRVPDEPATGEEVAALVAAMNTIKDDPKGSRRGFKLAFVRQFGQPAELMKSKLEAARRFITNGGGTFSDPAAAEGASPTDATETGVTALEQVSSGSGPAEDRGHVGAPPGSPPGETSEPDGFRPPAADGSGPPTGPPHGAQGPSAPTPPKPSTKDQRGRIAMRVKELTDKGLLREGDKPEIVAMLTGERAQSTTEITAEEASKVISTLAFIEGGDLSMEDSETGGREIACLTQRGKDFLAPIVEAFA
jgi:hypothetical protein